MRILSFDQASHTSGWALFENNKLIKHGKFTFNDNDFGIRLEKIRNKVAELVKEYSPDKVYFEDIQLQENVDTFKILAEVFGVIYELLTELKIPNEAIVASSWKGGLGIKGADRPAQKANAKKYVEKTFSISPTQDECDAICIGHFACTKKEETFDWAD